MRQIFVLAVIGLLSLSMACSDSGPSGPETTRVTGTWTGSATGLTFTFTLSESASGSITGSGSVGSAAATVFSGTHAGSTVSFTFGASGFEDANFTGELSNSTTMTGAVNGSGFSNFALTLRKQ